MKKLLLLFLILIPFLGFSQTGFEASRNNATNQTTERYVINSPGNSPTTSVPTWRTKDSTYIEWLFKEFYFRTLPNTVDNGSSSNYLYTDAGGKLRSGAISRLFADTSIVGTKWWVNTNFYNKTEADLRFLQSFTELDPLSLHIADTTFAFSSFLRKNDTINKWKPISYVPAWTDITGKPSFSTVATSGDYADLINKPTLFSGVYADLTGKPTLFSGDYNDLTNKPTIPAAPVNADWNASSGLAQILNKPTLFSGAYADLTGKPTLFSGDYNDLTSKPNLSLYYLASNPSGYISGITSGMVQAALGYIPLAPVDTNSLSTRINAKFTIPTGTTGQYLRGDGTPAPFPSIPAAQVNSDWNSVSGVSQILNKPTLSAVATSGNYSDLSGTPNLTSYMSKSDSIIYQTKFRSDTARTNTYNLIGTKFTIPSGNTLQYVRGDGTLGTTPTGTVTNVTSSDNTLLTITNGTTTPQATVVAAPKLQTARNINGTSFNGTADITIPGSAITNIPNTSLTNSSITINGNSVALGGSTTVTASPNIGNPSAGNSLTSGTAFQPRSGGPCNIVINSSLGSGLAAVTGTIVIAMSSTQNGTYTTVTTDGLILSLLNASLDRSSATIPVPTGWWIKVTSSTVGVGATVTSTYTKWDL